MKYETRYDSRRTQALLADSGISVPKLSSYAPGLGLLGRNPGPGPVHGPHLEGQGRQPPGADYRRLGRALAGQPRCDWPGPVQSNPHGAHPG